MTKNLPDAAVAEPHAEYARLRSEAAVTRIVLPDGGPAWLVTRYDEARAVLADPRMRKAPLVRPENLSGPSVRGMVGRSMLSIDPPDHTRQRRLVARAFSSRRIAALEPRIRQLTDDLLDAAAEQAARTGGFDLIAALAHPLPLQVICELLGVPAEHRDKFRDWSGTMVAGAWTDGHHYADAVRGFLAYNQQLIAGKRADPGDDLLSALVAAREEGDQLSEQELVSMVWLLLIAGHETTVNLIGNGTFLLLTHPGEQRRLRADPSLLPTAVEEFLRHEAPVQTSTSRITSEPVEIGGVTIPAGQLVLVSLLSANRDGSVFPDADTLDLGRVDNPHLAFGHGVHHCLGAPLARLEARIAFDALLRRFPTLRLAAPTDQLVWRPGLLMHGLVALPVATR